jgi:hypothetical protein
MINPRPGNEPPGRGHPEGIETPSETRRTKWQAETASAASSM